MDPLSDIVSLLRPHTVFSKPITGRGKWGVRYAKYELPSFCIMLEGQCWLTIDGEPPRRLHRGDFILLPVTPAFSLTSHPGVGCRAGRPGRTAIRHGEPKGRPDFRMIGGTFQVEQANTVLLSLLPKLVHIRAAECDTRRLTGLIDLIADEFQAARPGRDMILEHLLEVLLVESLRWSDSNAVPSGLLAGMQDKALAGALRAIHSAVGRKWTVASLAKQVGLSRSAFALRFSATVGCAPMEYLIRWRMSLARDALRRGKTSLDQLAEAIGYESASAFSTAFRKRVGCAPGAFTRSRSTKPSESSAPTPSSANRSRLR